MCTHFNKKIRVIADNLLILFILMSFPVFSFAQYYPVSVTSVIYPPFSPKLSYYLDHADKVNVTLINTSARPLNVYIQGHFTGDNGIDVSTEDGYKPDLPITLEPNIPFQLTPYNIEKIFSVNHLVFSGITKDEMLQNKGFPEGTYQMCFRAFNYDNGQPLSSENTGCSNPIFIQYVDPPIILYPTCGDSIDATPVQNLIFTWTVPATAGIAYSYHFIMAEVQPGNRNPYDALASAAKPYFYETEVNSNQLIIGAAEPQLTEGRTYAFVVQAVDINNEIQFKNNGTSEVCWFTYRNKKELKLSTGTGTQFAVENNSWNDFTKDFGFLPFTTIQGQLFTKMASLATDNVTAEQPGTANTSSTFSYGMLSNTSTNGTANNNNLGLGGISFNNINKNVAAMSFAPPFGSGTLNEKVLSKNNAEPLRNTMIRLVARLSYKSADGFPNVREAVNENGFGGTVDLTKYRFFDLQGNEIGRERILKTLNCVMDVTTTDAQGNFSFDFQTDYFTGPFYAISKGASAAFGKSDYNGYVSLKVEVINQKFCSPDVDIFAQHGDNVSLSSQVALIKDFDVDLTVLSEFDYYTGDEKSVYLGQDNTPKTIPGGGKIKNAIVKVLRDMQKLNNEHPAVLLAEGQKLGTTIKNSNGEFKEVFTGTTDENGQITIPNLVQHWGVVDGENKSPYYLSVATRNEDADSTYENTIYNFETYFSNFTAGNRINTDAAGTSLLDDDAGWAGSAPVMYNHFYRSVSYSREIALKAAAPEMKGRLMVKTNLENIGLANQEVRLEGAYLPDMPGMLEAKQVTNSAGFFRFKNLWVRVNEYNEAEGPYRRIHVMSPLYKSVMRPPKNEQPRNLKYGELYFQEIQLEPRQVLKGKVINEKGEPVAAYVKLLPDNPYAKTEPRWDYDSNGSIYRSGEYFEIPAHNYGVNRIEILPLSNQYYHDTVEVTGFDPHNVKTFTVSGKLHRLRLQLYDKDSQGVISNATVVVGDTLVIGKTNNAGIAEIVFPSPGEQFIVKVFAENYSPLQAAFSIPVAKNWQEETLQLKYALHISGTVKELGSGQPIDSALIYTQLQNTDGHALYLQTYSDKDGKYRLNGLPYYTLPTEIKVYAVKKGGTPSYIGSEKPVTIKAMMITNGYDFYLKKADGWDLTNIWGFPVSIEKMKMRINTGTTISGYFYDLPHGNDFNTVNSNEKIHFKDLKISKGLNGKIVPASNMVITKLHTLPIKIKGGFEGRLFDTDNNLSTRFLKIKKNGEAGYINGGLKIDLASFKFAYDFHGDMYVGEDTTKTEITVFKSNPASKSGNSKNFSNISNIPNISNSLNISDIQKNSYYIFDIHHLVTTSYPVPVSDFRVFGFNASSGFGSAYLQNGVINIGVTLHTDIPMANHAGNLDLKIKAGQIQITKDNMDLVTNPNSPLEFDLEKWKVISKNGYTFDKTRDALVIKKATISTGLGVNVGISNLLIRPTALRDGIINVGDGLTLGGITPLTLDKNIKPVFNYDAGVGHYRVSMVGTASGPVAWVNSLPATTGRLEFTSIGMLSDNSTILSLGRHLKFHKILDIYVDQIMSGDGFFTLAGMPKPGIPGYIATRAEMTFSKKGGKVVAKLEPLSGIVDCNANVVYKLEQQDASQTLTENKYTAYGNFFVKPPPGQSGEDVELRGFLVKTPGECYIDVVPQTIKMGKEEMKVTEGKISVTGNEWGVLSFDANTNSTGLEDKNIVSFTVPGGIKANSDGVEVSNIETPLGDLDMAYIFPEKALVGKLVIKTGLNMGFATINSGMMATRFDPNGFYLGFTGQVTFSSDIYDGGFLLGVYNADLNDVAGLMLKNFEKSKPNFSSLHGFYAIGQRTLIDKTFPLLIIDVSAKAGLGAFVHLDYADEKFIVGGYGFAKFKGGVNITGCGFVGVKQSAFAEISGGYKSGNLQITNCMESSTCVEACTLKGCLDVLNRVKISTGKPIEVTLQMNGKCSNFKDD